MDHGVTECLTSGSLGDVSWVQKAASQLYRRNLPLLHMSTQHPGNDQFYQAFPRISAASNKCGVRMRRPGYEATYWVQGPNMSLSVRFLCTNRLSFTIVAVLYILYRRFHWTCSLFCFVAWQHTPDSAGCLHRYHSKEWTCVWNVSDTASVEWYVASVFHRRHSWHSNAVTIFSIAITSLRNEGCGLLFDYFVGNTNVAMVPHAHMNSFLCVPLKGCALCLLLPL